VAALGLVLLAVSLVVFAMLWLIPGDPAGLIAGVDARPEEVERLRVALGLDQPAYVQYGRYLGRVVTGDLGRSLRSQQPVADDLATRFAASLLLASVSLAVALVVGLPAGVTAAVWRGTAWDTVMTARRLDADLLVRADPHRLLLTSAAREIGAGGGGGRGSAPAG